MAIGRLLTPCSRDSSSSSSGDGGGGGGSGAGAGEGGDRCGVVFVVVVKPDNHAWSEKRTTDASDNRRRTRRHTDKQ